MFTDRVLLELKAGKGGDGVIAWHREKYIPKGGPAGGDGAKGGSIFFEVDPGLFSLEDYRHRRVLNAENGGQGGSNSRSGKTGKDLILKVPLGTLVKDAKTGEVLYDFTLGAPIWLACSGGKGGKGNARFKTPRERAPYKCTPGTFGETRSIELELKLIADVGLVGFPNAGKSTLLNALTDVKVKIAPYPFTTLRPNLGYLIDDVSGKRTLIADIPGIIKGASKNKGLGFEFLRHIERTNVLLFVLDASGIEQRTPLDDYKVLLKELKAYDPALLEKTHLIALNKVDTEESQEHVLAFKKKVKDKEIHEISALSGYGIEDLKRKLSK